MILTTVIYFFIIKAIGWLLFVILGSSLNVLHLYYYNLQVLLEYKTYLKGVLLKIRKNKERPFLSFFKNVLRIYLAFTIFIPIRLIQLGSPNIYFGLALVSSCSLFLQVPVFVGFGLTFLQYWFLHVLFVFIYKKKKTRQFIFWLYSFKDEGEVDVFFLQLISNPFRQLLSVSYRGAAAISLGYGLNIAEISYSEHLAMQNIELILAKSNHSLSPGEILDLKAKEQSRIYNTLPLRSAKLASESFVNDLDIIIRKRDK